MAKAQKAIVKEAISANYLLARQQLLYSHDEIKHFEESIAIKKFLSRMVAKSDNTAMVFKSRLAAFAQFVYRRHEKAKVDDFITAIKSAKHDPYDVLSDFASFLKTERTGKLQLSSNSIIAYTKNVLQERIASADERVAKARRRLADATARFGTNSKQARDAQDDLTKAMKNQQKVSGETPGQMLAMGVATTS